MSLHQRFTLNRNLQNFIGNASGEYKISITWSFTNVASSRSMAFDWQDGRSPSKTRHVFLHSLCNCVMDQLVSNNLTWDTCRYYKSCWQSSKITVVIKIKLLLVILGLLHLILKLFHQDPLFAPVSAIKRESIRRGTVSVPSLLLQNNGINTKDQAGFTTNTRLCQAYSRLTIFYFQ